MSFSLDLQGRTSAHVNVFFLEQGQPFDFNYYVVVVRSHVVSDTRLEAGKKRRKGKSNGATAVPKLEEPPVLDGFESELLQKVRSIGLGFEYPPHTHIYKLELLKLKFLSVSCIGLQAISTW